MVNAHKLQALRPTKKGRLIHIMLKIKAKINFDIVEQFDENVDPKFLFSDLPPAEVIYENGKVTRKATKKDKRAFFDYVMSDPDFIACAEERFCETTGEEDAA